MHISKTKLVFCFATWVLLVALGTWKMLSFDFTAGNAGRPPSRWPDGTALVRSEAQPTLVVFIHPRCPCSNATAIELERLQSQLRGSVKCIVVFSKPAGAPLDWCNTRTAKAFSRIANVETQIDEDNVEASRFGCSTSGQAFLFDHESALLFRGGLTASRGHEGQNDGSLFIQRLLSKRLAKFDNHFECAVYGCPL